jgi:hypothetical protein
MTPTFKLGQIRRGHCGQDIRNGLEDVVLQHTRFLRFNDAVFSAHLRHQASGRMIKYLAH